MNSNNKEKTILTVIALIILIVTFVLMTIDRKIMFVTMFCFELLFFCAIYLFQFGSLKEFNIEALSAKAKFITSTASEASETMAEINKLKTNSEKRSKEIIDIKKELQEKYKKFIETMEDEIEDLKGMVPNIVEQANIDEENYQEYGE